MTRTTLLALAVATATAQAAHAQQCGGRTFDQVIDDCDAAFPGINPLIVSARGWCYLIGGSTCLF